jgi:hypothetical protein
LRSHDPTVSVPSQISRPAALGKAPGRPLRERAERAAILADLAGEPTLAHAVELHRHRRKIDRADREPRRVALGQHKGAGVQHHTRRAIGHGHGKRGRAAQGRAIRAGQALAQRHIPTPTVTEARDTEPAALGGDGRARGRFDAHPVGPGDVAPWRQGTRELDAGARRIALGFGDDAAHGEPDAATKLG